MPGGTTLAGQSDSAGPIECAIDAVHERSFSSIIANAAGSAAARSCRSPRSTERSYRRDLPLQTEVTTPESLWTPQDWSAPAWHPIAPGGQPAAPKPVYCTSFHFPQRSALSIPPSVLKLWPMQR
jgi:hypothetical protein